jgi:hypothetical protein
LHASEGHKEQPRRCIQGRDALIADYGKELSRQALVLKKSDWLSGEDGW